MRLSPNGQLALGRDAGGARFAGTFDGRRWLLRAADDGPHRADPRGRLVVPIGVRAALGLGAEAGLSRCRDAVAIWSPAGLDALVEGPR